MLPPHRSRVLALSLSFTLACGPGDGDDSGTNSSTGASTSGASTGDATTGQASTGDATTTDTPTGGMTGDGTTTQTPTTGDATTDAPTTGDATTTDDTTTGVAVEFDRFRISRAAGPCPPDADCDGFTELLASRLLRFEPFGEVGNPVIEVEIDEADFSAAVAVFADPKLIALLDQVEPLCDPPTDVFEQMLVELDGGAHEKDTTTCQQPALTAARDAAEALVMKYVP